MSNSKSYSRIKFYLFLIVSTVFFFLHLQQELWGYEITFLILSGTSSIIAMRVKCEKCGILLFTYDKRAMKGVVNPTIIQPRKCPKCGVFRY